MLSFISFHRRLFAVLLVLVLLPGIAFLLLTPRGTKNYLIIGIDNYGSLRENGRSDVMMLVSLNYSGHRVSAVTFARDIVLEDSDRHLKKINTIVRTADENALVSVLSNNLDIPIDGWFRLNFSSFVSIIEAIGGIDIELTGEEASYITKEIGDYPGNPLSEGVCLLNGAQALSYVRCRRLDSDIGRGNRQSKVVSSLVKKSKAMGISSLLKLYDDMKHAWTSSLSDSEQFQLLVRCLWLRGASVNRLSVPFEGAGRYATVNGDNGIRLDLEKTSQMLRDALK